MRLRFMRRVRQLLSRRRLPRQAHLAEAGELARRLEHARGEAERADQPQGDLVRAIRSRVAEVEMNGTTQFYCCRCGQSRTFAPRAVRGLELLACLRCGSCSFTNQKGFAPDLPAGFLVTQSDRFFLKAMRIKAD